MTNEIIQTSQDTELSRAAQGGIHIAAQAADKVASDYVFTEYRDRKAPNTLKAHDRDLTLFSDFLNTVLSGYDSHHLATQPSAWNGITWGIVESFKASMLKSGYAIGTVNRALSTVKRYAKLAYRAGIITLEQQNLISAVTGYSRNEAANLNEKRDVTRRPISNTGASGKKAESTEISAELADYLKNSHDDTAQGRRDRLMMSLLIDMGLRCGELALLTVDSVKISRDDTGQATYGEITFMRPKVDKETPTRLELSPDALEAAAKWFDSGDAPLMGKLLRASRKGGNLTDVGMSERAITKRVKALGERAASDGLKVSGQLSAHDCRHYAATRRAAADPDMVALRDFFGWTSFEMPNRYIHAAKVQKWA